MGKWNINAENEFVQGNVKAKKWGVSFCEYIARGEVGVGEVSEILETERGMQELEVCTELFKC